MNVEPARLRCWLMRLAAPVFPLHLVPNEGRRALNFALVREKPEGNVGPGRKRCSRSRKRPRPQRARQLLNRGRIRGWLAERRTSCGNLPWESPAAEPAHPSFFPSRPVSISCFFVYICDNLLYRCALWGTPACHCVLCSIRPRNAVCTRFAVTYVALSRIGGE